MDGAHNDLFADARFARDQRGRDQTGQQRATLRAVAPRCCADAQISSPLCAACWHPCCSCCATSTFCASTRSRPIGPAVRIVAPPSRPSVANISSETTHRKPRVQRVHRHPRPRPRLRQSRAAMHGTREQRVRSPRSTRPSNGSGSARSPKRRWPAGRQDARQARMFSPARSAARGVRQQRRPPGPDPHRPGAAARSVATPFAHRSRRQR